LQIFNGRRGERCGRSGQRGAGTGGLEALDLFEGAVESALDAHLVAGEVVEALFVRAVPAIDKANAVGRVVVAAFAQGVLQVGQALVEVAAFKDAEAAKTPGGHGEVIHQLGLEGAGRGQFVLKGLQELVELGRVFGGKQGTCGGEAVGQRIRRGTGFAGGGLGAGAALSVAAIGFDLFF
jgi:hypothetical protein